MSVVYRPGLSSSIDEVNSNSKPVFVAKLEGCVGDINKAVFISERDGVISVSSDRSVRVWLKRNSGQYLPSICTYLPSPAVDLFYQPTTRQLFVGQENGTISKYTFEDDFNHLEHVGDILAHYSRITGMIWTEVFNNGTLEQWILSISRDKKFQYHNVRNGNPVGPSFDCAEHCTSLEYDAESANAFIGDNLGNITMLSIKADGLRVVTVLTGHTDCIKALSWDKSTKRLFSSGNDHSIIAWDIGAGQGIAYRLHGHTKRVTSLAFISAKKILMSAGEDSVLIFWDLNANRIETPPWTKSDNCECCRRPFLWNITGIFKGKQFGTRQHHCRSCGSSLCDKCSHEQSTIPLMGFELPVRVCKCCNGNIDRTALASFYDTKHSIMSISMDLERKRVLTVGQDRIIKMWDVSTLI